MIEDLKARIVGIQESFAGEKGAVRTTGDLPALREKYLGRKKGLVTSLMKGLRDVAPEDRPQAGKHINSLKTLVERELRELEDRLTHRDAGRIDYTLPAHDIPVGHAHLISLVRTEIEDIFLNMGYEIAYGPEVEDEYHNFTALNFMDHHPARDEQDTFFIEDMPEMILRTHTSPVQIRYMQKHPPPVKVISPGRVFRKDEPDATHTPVFTQVEGLLVDRGIHFSHLKGTLELFIKSFFGEDIGLRLRPGYFPFTEPSAEVDISCFLCSGELPTCRICKGTGWLEILGSGMVHPRVLVNCNIDPEVYSGFAFGMGVERIALLKYGISDLRMFYDNDIRFLRQFS